MNTDEQVYAFWPRISIRHTLVTILLPIATAISAGTWDDYLQSEMPFDKTYFSACLLANTKTPSSNEAAKQISEACKIKAAPKMCRQLTIADAWSCTRKCNDAGMWSKNYGQCSLG